MLPILLQGVVQLRFALGIPPRGGGHRTGHDAVHLGKPGPPDGGTFAERTSVYDRPQKSLDRISSQKVHSRVHQQLEKRFADQFDSPDFYLGTELARLYREALAQLPEQTRRIFEMSRFQGMTHQQIAAEMEVSPQTVNYHIGQALKVLGVALKDYLPLIALFFEMPGNN